VVGLSLLSPVPGRADPDLRRHAFIVIRSAIIDAGPALGWAALVRLAIRALAAGARAAAARTRDEHC